MLLFFTLQPGFAATDIPIFSYYTDPPFNAKLPDNLTARLADWLTEHSNGEYRFKAHSLPRKRLQNVLSQNNWQGVVAWASPTWFADTGQQRFLWSQALGEDLNLVVSHKNNPIIYRQPTSLTGTTLGGILGHHYAEFDGLIAAGKIKREDIADTSLNLLKLKAGRVDVMFLPASSLPHYRGSMPDLDNWLYIAEVPRNSFKRYMFTRTSNTQLMNYINQQIDAIKLDPHWQSIFNEFSSALAKNQ